MSRTPKAPPTKAEVLPGEDIWTALARELVARPEGPVALGVISQINQATRPRQQAYARLVEAYAKLIEDPKAAGIPADIELAKESWREACSEDVSAAMVDMVQKEAAALVEQRKTMPPDLSAVLLDGADGRRDFGYELGGDLSGLQGTWHRLWALISLDRYLGHGDSSKATSEVRNEFETQLGRALAPVEWDQLVKHAHRHCDDVMKVRLSGEGSNGADS